MNLNYIKKIALEALNNAYKIHEKLGCDGETLIKKNRFEETALKLDIEAEKTVIQTFKRANLSIKIISEEHGEFIIGKNPKYLAILDGLDGSSIYKKSRGTGRYGTMLGIFANTDPIYNDYLFNGAIEHSTNKIFYAIKNSGAFMIKNNTKRTIHTINQKKLNTKQKIYIDEDFDINRKTFSSKLLNFNTAYLGSSCAHYIDIASGNAILTLECTRKNNLEIAVAYGLIKEAGGVMMTLDKKELGRKKYYTFGQKHHIPIVTACTTNLALDLIDYIERSK